MMKNQSIGIIGMGSVGASVAISILQKGICQELLLNDMNEELAEGEAMDLTDGSTFYPVATVKKATIEEMRSCRAVVITAGKNSKGDESRLSLLKDNVKIAKDISDKLRGFEGILIIVTNPVDVLTYFYQKFTGFPSNRVIGTGTLLDTSRLRDFIGKKLQVHPKSIHANVIGEHGDSEVTLWSQARIGNIMIRDWMGWDKQYEEEISEKVRTSAYEIIKRKGATNHAIGLVTSALLKWIFRGERRLVNVSTVLEGQYGLHNLALSLPSLISEKGVERVMEIPLSQDEKDKLLKSAQVLSKAIESV
jgi:L-lactate dehydrogenase